MLSSGILNWNLNGSLAKVANKDRSFFCFISLYLLSLENIENVPLHIDSDVGIINF